MNNEKNEASEELSVFILHSLRVLQKIAYGDVEFLDSPDDDEDFAGAVLAAQKMREHFELDAYTDPELVELWNTPGVPDSMTFV